MGAEARYERKMCVSGFTAGERCGRTPSKCTAKYARVKSDQACSLIRRRRLLVVNTYFSNSWDGDACQAESPGRAGFEVETDDAAHKARCLKVGELAEGHFGQARPANGCSGELPQRGIFRAGKALGPG